MSADADPEGAAARAFVQTFARGLAVVRALGEQELLTVSEAAREVDVSRAAARRLLLTLEQLGYARRSGEAFALTPKVLELGYGYLSSLTLPEVAQPHLERLTARVGESSSVSVLDGPDIVYVARVPMRRIMTVAIAVGTRFPAYATSMGRVLLAGLDPAPLAAVLDATSFEPLTPATIVDREELERELERVRARGWALVDQELEIGLRSLAAPIRGGAGEAVAAVNVSVAAATAGVAEIEAGFLEPLLEAAAAIEADLGATTGGAASRAAPRP